MGLKVRLHVPSPSPSNFIIVSIVIDRLMDKMDLELILSINENLTVTVTETERVNGPLMYIPL